MTAATIADIERQAELLMSEAARRQGLSISEWVARRTRHAADVALAPSPGTAERGGVVARARAIVAAHYQAQLDEAAVLSPRAGGNILRNSIERTLAGKEDHFREMQIATAAIAAERERCATIVEKVTAAELHALPLHPRSISPIGWFRKGAAAAIRTDRP